jgi:hypothetical protein
MLSILHRVSRRQSITGPKRWKKFCVNAIVWQDNRICDIQYDRDSSRTHSRSSADLRIFRLVIVDGSRADACARSLPARPRDNPPTTDTIYRNLVATRRKCSARSRHIASDLVYLSDACAAEASSASVAHDPMQQPLRMTFEGFRLIHADHPSLPGHFPGAPLVPGVVILDEVIAALDEWRRDSQLSGIRSVKFLAPLKPEQAFTISLSREMSTLAR